MPDETQVMPALGKPGEPCEQCGAALAADQRYCLECGNRRGGPRVEYRGQPANGGTAPGAEASEAARPAPPPGEAESGPKAERDYAPLAAVGGIAVLGLMLLVGVLIGKGDSDGGTQTPVVIEGGKGGGAAEGTGGEGGSEGGGLAGGGKGASGSGAKGGNQGVKNEGGGGGGEEPVEASTKDLEELENETGEDAAKNALKLPDKIATPGKPPPIDKSKAPGAGEGGVTIE